MKTPREVLLERHRSATPKLDAIREKVVATTLPGAASPAPEPLPIRAALALWRELVLPCRRIWAGVAAVWLAIAALHLATGASPKMAAGQMAASGRDVMMALREQKQILAELLDPASPPPTAALPVVPGPRGDIRPILRSA